MAQIFRKRSNTLARACLLLIPVVLAGAVCVSYAIYWSPYMTRVNVPQDQPVPFSHKHHVFDIGIDCRYCHTSPENSSFAGMPSTETCMSCHSQLWTTAPMLAPVRESFARGQPLRWNRVNDLPDFVFFNHSIHVAKGIGCVACHGPVDQMPLGWRANSLYMKWCLDCHRQPEKFVQPREEVFNPSWTNTNGLPGRLALAAQYHIHRTQLEDCSVCHR